MFENCYDFLKDINEKVFQKNKNNVLTEVLESVYILVVCVSIY